MIKIEINVPIWMNEDDIDKLTKRITQDLCEECLAETGRGIDITDVTIIRPAVTETAPKPPPPRSL